MARSRFWFAVSGSLVFDVMIDQGTAVSKTAMGKEGNEEEGQRTKA